MFSKPHTLVPRQSHPTSDLVQMLTVGTQAETGRALEIAYQSQPAAAIPALIPLTLIWKVRRALFHACLILITLVPVTNAHGPTDQPMRDAVPMRVPLTMPICDSDPI